MSQTLQAALTDAGQRLSVAGIEDYRREARILLAFVLGIDALQVSLRLDETLTAEHSVAFEAALKSRMAHVPMSHILGYREFYEHRFIVTPDVLDPRPETEELVARALSAPFQNVLDLGVGSGCIILSLLAVNSSACGVAVDCSAKALEVARRNAAKLQLTDRVRFCRSDWCAEIPSERFDLIVSNPPYIEANDPHLALLKHEPQEALVSGSEGLQDIQTIVENAHKNLAQGGWLLIEHGWQQAAQVRALLQAAGYGHVQSKLDLAGIERCSGGQK